MCGIAGLIYRNGEAGEHQVGRDMARMCCR